MGITAAHYVADRSQKPVLTSLFAQFSRKWRNIAHRGALSWTGSRGHTRS